MKNIDRARLPKSTITLKEKINKEIYEDSEDYSLKNNKEFSLSSSEPSYEYFSIESDDNSPTTVHVNDEHSMSKESEISDDFNGTARATNKNIQKAFPIRYKNLIQKECMKLLSQ